MKFHHQLEVSGDIVLGVTFLRWNGMVGGVYAYEYGRRPVAGRDMPAYHADSLTVPNPTSAFAPAQQASCKLFITYCHTS